MSEHNFKITGYSIHLGERSKAKAETQAGKEKEILITAVLTCRGDGGERIAVQFHNEAQTFKTVSHLGDKKKPAGIIFEPQTHYSHYVDLLRNESPIWGYIEIRKGAPEVKIYTGRWEPVGVGDEDYRTDPTR